MESVGLPQLNSSNRKSVSVEQIGNAARARSAAVAAETAGYIVLLIVRNMADNWRQGEGHSVELGPDGELVHCSGTPVSQQAAEQGLRRLLAELLEFARAPSPALSAIAACSEASAIFPGLEKQLLSALVPLNEAAARRGLARLWRQTAKHADSVVVSEPLSKPKVNSKPAVLPIESQLSGSLPVARLAEQLSLFDDSVVLPQSQGPSAGKLSDDCGMSAVEIPVEVDCSDWDIPSSRSDLRELIGGFLAESNSSDRMSRELRRSIGIEE